MYLKNSELPKNKMEAQVLRLKVTRCVIYENKLYMRGYSMPLIKCVKPSEAEYIMREIYKGTCWNHARGQLLAFKTLRQGYY